MRVELKKTDPEIDRLIQREILRQQETINLIPSENFVSHAVIEATGSVLSNKYSEGYPNRRYYQGNDYAENSLSKSCSKIFGSITNKKV
jgi:glycine hydroxymethyltransferase